VKQSEINTHPVVAPILAEWRRAREARNAAELDKRVGYDREVELSRKADTWGSLYERACQAVRDITYPERRP
jgi:hypothetical protein